MDKALLVRITTVPQSLDKLLDGQLRFMSEHFHVIAVSSDADQLKKVGEKESVEVFHVQMTRKITPIQDFQSVWKLYRFLKRIEPQIVHTHTPKAGIVGMTASWLAGVPHRLHTVAGLPLLEATGAKRKLLDFVEKLTYRFATQVYPNSKGLYDIILANKYCAKEKLKVIGNGSSNGINTSKFSPEAVDSTTIDALRNELNLTPEDFVFIFVGRLVADKGINELVQAFKLLSNEYQRIKLLLVGPYEDDLDPVKPETKQTIESHEAIITVGFQSDVRKYFAVSDALAFPSYREGFPNVVMQAGAMGLPSIVSNINGCNEIIVDGHNGMIIRPKSAEELYEAMKKMVSDSQAYNRMKESARPMIVSRYEQERVWEALLNEYRALDV